MGRFGKRDDLIVHEKEPFNAETGLESLTDPVTDTDAFYVRCHGSVPEIDRSAWRLRVDGMVERELSL
jgi:sulfite oxidase